MYFDALTLAAVRDELNTTILGGRVQRVLLPDSFSIGMEIYAHHQRHHLFASAHPRYARVHLVCGKLSRGMEQATPLLLLLRKYVLGGFIRAIEQPPLERVLILSIVKETRTCNQDDSALPDADDDTITSSPLSSEIIIEMMERRSNIILVDDTNVILESVKRVTPQMSYRAILPRHAYETPPAQQKLNPHTASANGVAEACAAEGGNLARGLVRGYLGVSPQAAREVVYRAGGGDQGQSTGEQQQADWTAPPERVAACLRELFAAPWEPSLVMGEQGPRAYAPYPITHLGGAQPCHSISVALDTFYTAEHDVTAHHQRREAVQQQLTAAHERLQHQYRVLEMEQEKVHDLDRLRWEGEMIFAFLHTLSPGQRSLEVEGKEIVLDPNRSPSECAQQRFRAYEKAKSGALSVAERLQATRVQLDGVEQLAVLLELAHEREQIEQIAQEAEEQGYGGGGQQVKRDQQRRQPYARPKPLHRVSSDGFDMYIGRTARQNDDVTFRIGRPDDLWLHARGVPGAHVVVRCGGRDVPETTLREAAALAAYYSRARGEAAVDVVVCWRKHVRKGKGAPPGLVTYREGQTIRVAPTVGG